VSDPIITIQGTSMKLPQLIIPVAISIIACSCTTERQKDAVGAATSPLTDLNLIQSKIPESLKTAHNNPYGMPTDNSCDSLKKEIIALDEALGPDLDTPATVSNPGVIERATDLVGDQAVSAIRRTAEGVVPFRDWVRKLSGAERHSKQLDAAIAAGIVRRAYLKGLRSAQSCSA
jgi:hypothetical protein